MDLDAAMVLYAEVNIVCIALLLMVEVRLRMSMNRTAAQYSYEKMILGFLVLFGIDTLWSGLRAHRGLVNSRVIVVIWVLYFIVLSICAYLWFYFDQNRMGIKGAEEEKARILLLIPIGLVLVWNLVNLKTGHLYVILGDGELAGRPLGVINYMVPVFYIVLGELFNYLHYKKLSEDEKSLAPVGELVYLVPTCIVGVLQFVFPNVPLLTAGTTVALLTAYAANMDDSISRDALTHLNNRRQFVRYLSARMGEKRDGKNKLYVMVLDIDYFKEINDRFGHMAGDRALVRISNAMRKCVGEVAKRAQLSRYGGDEFVIVLETDQPELPGRLAADIQAELDHTREEAEDPMRLQISYGLAECPEKGATVNSMIEMADEAMYKMKSNHHSRRSEFVENAV